MSGAEQAQLERLPYQLTPARVLRVMIAGVRLELRAGDSISPATWDVIESLVDELVDELPRRRDGIG